MKIQSLIIHEKPSLVQPYLVMGFEGWPDAGRVSSGVVRYLLLLAQQMEQKDTVLSFKNRLVVFHYQCKAQ